jgi:hypothetical protein
MSCSPRLTHVWQGMLRSHRTLFDRGQISPVLLLCLIFGWWDIVGAKGEYFRLRQGLQDSCGLSLRRRCFARSSADIALELLRGGDGKEEENKESRSDRRRKELTALISQHFLHSLSNQIQDGLLWAWSIEITSSSSSRCCAVTPNHHPNDRPSDDPSGTSPLRKLPYHL